MNSTTTISPLEAFRKAFPFLNWIVDEPILCYPFLDLHWSERGAEKARRLILSQRLPLVASAEKRWFGESYRPVLIVRPVPEEYTFADEVQDDEEYEEERAEWPQ